MNAEQYTAKQRVGMMNALENDGAWIGYAPDPLVNRGMIAFSESRGQILTPWGESEARRLKEETSR